MLLPFFFFWFCFSFSLVVMLLVAPGQLSLVFCGVFGVTGVSLPLSGKSGSGQRVPYIMVHSCYY